MRASGRSWARHGSTGCGSTRTKIAKVGNNPSSATQAHDSPFRSNSVVKFHTPHEFPDLRQNPDPRSVSNFQGSLEQATAEAVNSACVEKTRQVLQGCLHWNPHMRASAADVLQAAPLKVQNIQASAAAAQPSPPSSTSPASTISTLRLTRAMSTPSPETPSRQLQAAHPAMSSKHPEPPQHGHTNARQMKRTSRYVLDVPHTLNGQSSDEERLPGIVTPASSPRGNPEVAAVFKRLSEQISDR